MPLPLMFFTARQAAEALRPLAGNGAYLLFTVGLIGTVQARADPFDLVLTDLSMPEIDGRQLSETLRQYRPSVAVLCMSADPDAVPYIESSDTPVRVLLKPFTADDLYHAVRDAITRATDLAAIAEAEIVRAHAGLSKLALALEASRTMRVQTLDLVVAARELRRAAVGPS